MVNVLKHSLLRYSPLCLEQICHWFMLSVVLDVSSNSKTPGPFCSYKIKEDVYTFYCECVNDTSEPLAYKNNRFVLNNWFVSIHAWYLASRKTDCTGFVSLRELEKINWEARTDTARNRIEVNLLSEQVLNPVGEGEIHAASQCRWIRLFCSQWWLDGYQDVRFISSRSQW